MKNSRRIHSIRMGKGLEKDGSRPRWSANGIRGGRFAGFKTRNCYIRWNASASRIELLPYITQGRMALTFSGRAQCTPRLFVLSMTSRKRSLQPHNSGNGQYRSKQWEARKNGFNFQLVSEDVRNFQSLSGLGAFKMR